ncbi:MAG: endonuclease III [Oscillospiraceae bacterium]|nr:endonuclease III [Oscillospiraceae bacterium]
MTKEEIALKACDILEEYYPESVCALRYSEPYELLIAVRLSAQCTDARVNIVTETLFQKYPTLEAFANADLTELEQDVKPCGFYRTKAKSIIEMANRLIDVYDSRIPDTMEELLTLSGVGRKTANLILGDVYGQPAIVTDTHFIRITGRLGLTDNKEPEKVERDLRPLIPPERSSDFCHRIVQFGRDVCTARKPKCNECRMQDFCKHYRSQ